MAILSLEGILNDARIDNGAVKNLFGCISAVNLSVEQSPTIRIEILGT
jgi:hypothetical protein